MRLAWVLAGVALLIQVLTNGRYGYFRDELYLVACSDHLAAGYVDLAPLSAWVLHFNRILFGDSLHAFRFLSTLAFGVEVVLTGYIARELGARRWGVFLASTSVVAHYYSCPHHRQWQPLEKRIGDKTIFAR